MSNQDLLLSLIIPSRRIKQLEGLLDSFQQNTRDTSRIELIVKCDDDQLPEYREFLTRKRAETGLNIRWISTPRLFGVFTMWINIQLLWRAVSPNSYFVLALTDEGRFPEKNWDDEIAQYKGYYPDHIFRLRLSIARDVNYYNVNQTITMPDCFPVFTRRWLEITDGFGDCWGADAIHESIAYHLGRGTGSAYAFYARNAHFRDLVINKRLLGGIDDFAKDLKPDEHAARELLTFAEWKRVVGKQAQTQVCMKARKMLFEIYAHENNLTDYTIVHKPETKRMRLVDSTGHTHLNVRYALPFWFTAMAVLQFNMLERLIQVALWMRRHPTFHKSFWACVHGSIHAARWVRNTASSCVKTALRIFKMSGKKAGNSSDPTFDEIFYQKQLVGVNHGKLFSIEGKQLVPTKFMLRNIKKAKFVNCSPEDLTHWVEVAFSDKPFTIEPSVAETHITLDKKAS